MLYWPATATLQNTNSRVWGGRQASKGIHAFFMPGER